MQSRYLWMTVAIGLIALQALVRPEANILSLRDDSLRILLRITPSQGILGIGSGGLALVMEDPDCGFSVNPVDLARVASRVSEISGPIQASAESIFRTDLASEVVRVTPPWRIRGWQLLYGLGLWSGRLHDTFSPASPDQITEGRRFATNYYRERIRRVTCDAVRALR